MAIVCEGGRDGVDGVVVVLECRCWSSGSFSRESDVQLRVEHGPARCLFRLTPNHSLLNYVVQSLRMKCTYGGIDRRICSRC